MDIDFFPSLDDTMETVIFMFLALTAFLFAYLFFKWARRVRKSETHMTVQELKELKQKKLLTDEELARVRSSMAKQYMEVQEEEARLKKESNLKGLDALALELERVEQNIEITKQDKNSRTTNTEPSSNPQLVPEKNKVETPPPLLPKEEVIEKPILPDNLKAYVGMSEFELEDAVNAGFISSAEMQEIINFQEN